MERKRVEDDGLTPCRRSADRVCLLFDREPNRERVTEALAERFGTVTPSSVEDAVAANCDLYVIDAPTLERHGDVLGGSGEDAVSTPVLLLTDREQSGLSEAVWDMTDDVVTVPVTPTVLERRAANLVERHRLAREVAEERDRAASLFGRVFEGSNDAICIADLETERVTEANPAASSLFGREESELQSLPIGALCADVEAFRSFAETVRAEGTGRIEGLQCTDADGDSFPVSLSAATVDVDGRPHLVTTIRDVSEKRARERERARSERYRRRLYEVTSDPETTFEETLDAVMELGRERLGVENSHLVEVDVAADTHEVRRSSGSDVVEAGDVSDLDTSYCRRTVETSDVIALHDAPAQGWADDPAYEAYGLPTYASSRVVVGDDVFGTVCFVDREAREDAFSEREKTFVELIARWIGHELERRERTRVLRGLHGVTVDLLEAADAEEITATAVDAVESVFDAEAVAVYERADETLEPTSVADPGSAFEAPPAAVRVGEGPVGRAAETGETVRADDLGEATETHGLGSLRSALCLPVDGHGVLVCGSTTVGSFGRSTREELELLATNTAAALSRAERERRLREAHLRRSKLFENSTDGVVEVTFDDGVPRISNVNQEFESTFGYDAADVVGEDLQEVVVPPGRVSESDAILDRALEGEPFETEVRRETADGRRDFLFRVIPIQDDGAVTGGYAVYTDVTDRRRREQQLQVFNRILRHNLSNKVNVIHGQALRACDLVDGEVADAVGAIADAARDLLDLTEKTATLRKATRRTARTETVDVAATVDDVAASVGSEYEDATLTTDVPAGVEAVGGDLLGVAVHEVTENAAKHAEDAGVRVTASADDRWVEVAVADDGPGIPEVERETLESGLETPLQHGSGLGLWIVDWIAGRLGGALTIDESTDAGTTVTLRVPRGHTDLPEDVGSPFDGPGW